MFNQMRSGGILGNSPSPGLINRSARIERLLPYDMESALLDRRLFNDRPQLDCESPDQMQGVIHSGMQNHGMRNKMGSGGLSQGNDISQQLSMVSNIIRGNMCSQPPGFMASSHNSGYQEEIQQEHPNSHNYQRDMDMARGFNQAHSSLLGTPLLSDERNQQKRAFSDDYGLEKRRKMSEGDYQGHIPRKGGYFAKDYRDDNEECFGNRQVSTRQGGLSKERPARKSDYQLERETNTRARRDIGIDGRTADVDDYYDPATPTVDEKSMNWEPHPTSRQVPVQSEDTFTATTCNVCGVKCSDLKLFKAHMTGPQHKQRMDDWLNKQNVSTTILTARHKAEQHLRNLEGKQQRCLSCNIGYNESKAGHYSSREHKRRARLTGRGCPLCKIDNFLNYNLYVEHIAGEGHKNRKEEEHGDKRASTKQSGAAMSKAEPSKAISASNKEPAEKPEKVSSSDECREEIRNETEQSKNGKANVEQPHVSEKGTPPEQVKAKPIPQPTATVEVKPYIALQVGTPKEGASTEMVSNKSQFVTKPLSATEPLEYNSVPEFNPDVPAGQEYVIAVSGFFCKLCHKFYNNEAAAKISHCVSKPHFDKFEKAVLAKLQKKRAAYSSLTVSLEKSLMSSEPADPPKANLQNDGKKEANEQSSELSTKHVTRTSHPPSLRNTAKRGRGRGRQL